MSSRSEHGDVEPEIAGFGLALRLTDRPGAGFEAHVVQLPEVRAVGATREEAKRELLAALATHIRIVLQLEMGQRYDMRTDRSIVVQVAEAHKVHRGIEYVGLTSIAGSWVAAIDPATWQEMVEKEAGGS